MNTFTNKFNEPLKVETTIDTLIELTDMVQKGDKTIERLQSQVWDNNDELFQLRRELALKVENASRELENLQLRINESINERQRLYARNEELGKSLENYRRASGEYFVRLLDVGPNKINCIKIVRDYEEMGLKEVKDLVESAPCMLVVGISQIAAMELTDRLTANESTVLLCKHYDYNDNENKEGN